MKRALPWQQHPSLHKHYHKTLPVITHLVCPLLPGHMSWLLVLQPLPMLWWTWLNYESALQCPWHHAQGKPRPPCTYIGHFELLLVHCLQ